MSGEKKKAAEKKTTAEKKPTAEKKTPKKAYNNTFQTVIAIWDVLMEYSSKENPLSVKQIIDILGKKDSKYVPSANSVRRYFSGDKAVFDAICPTHVLREEGRPAATGAYVYDNALHVVIEDAAGVKKWSGGMSAVFEPAPSAQPCYSTIANLLGNYPVNAEDSLPLPPVRLKCVVESRGKSGKTTYIPYQTWSDKYENVEDVPQNKTRYYYLESVLSKAEWKILADAVKVYPCITEQQTKALLSKLKKLNPGKRSRLYEWDQSYYAYKRSRNDKFDKFFDMIDKAETAISEQRAVAVTYGKYTLEKQKDGNWEPVLKKRENKHDPKYGLWRIEPYELMWSNGYYYLVGKNTGYGMMNLRVDRIIGIRVLSGDEAHFDRDMSFNPYQYRDKSPIMYPGKSERIRLRCSEDMVNVLLDVFGSQARFSEPKDGYTDVSLCIAPFGVKLFAMEYAGHVEVLEPKTLRDEVREALKAALEVYK